MDCIRRWLAVLGMAMASLWCCGGAWAADCPAPGAITDVEVPGHPFATAASADNCWLFVSLANGKGKGAIAVLQNHHGSFLLGHTATLSDAAFGMALSHDGQVLAVTAENGVDVLDVARLEQNAPTTLLGTLGDGAGRGSVYALIGPDDRLLFVSEENAGTVSVFDLAKARGNGFHATALVGRIPIARAPVGLALSPDGHSLYATSEVAPPALHLSDRCETPGGGPMHAPGLLFRVDVDKAANDPPHAVIAIAPAGCSPVRVATTPSGTQVWVTSRGDDALLQFRSDDLRPGNADVGYVKLPIGGNPVGVAVRPDGAQVWVALSERFHKDVEARVVGITNAANGTPATLLSLPAPGFPRELAFLPDGRTLVVTQFDAGRVKLIPTPP